MRAEENPPLLFYLQIKKDGTFVPSLELVEGYIRFAYALLNDQKALPFGSRFAPLR